MNVRHSSNRPVGMIPFPIRVSVLDGGRRRNRGHQRGGGGDGDCAMRRIARAYAHSGRPDLATADEMSDMPSRIMRTPIHERTVNQTTGRKERHMRKHLVITAAAGAAALLGGAIVVGVARAGDDDERGTDRQSAFVQTNLVSNLSTVGAKITDHRVENPWGMASAPGGPLWVANNGAAVSTVYTLKNEVPQIQ